MTDHQWQCAWEIYRAASELSDGERRSYLASLSTDPEVFAEVALLLEEPAPQPFPSPDIEAGTQIGRYEVMGSLGRGGMACVYSALDTELGRFVALKFLAPEVVATRPAMDRLIREAKAASAMNHPHIVTVYEVVRSGGDVAIAMELVEGESLRTYCGKPQPVAQVIGWGRQAAQALAAAHGRNIVHRDIKPENLMVRLDGYIKVLDFGLARELTPAGRSPSANASAPSGRLAGTLNYMAPEQTRAAPTTGASDVFSLGAVLYELVTGTHPFLSDSPIDTAHAIAHLEPRPPRSLNREVPPVLNSLLLAMLAKNPDDRPSALEVDRKLSAIELKCSAALRLSEAQPFPHSARKSRRLTKIALLRYWLLAAGLMVCLACVVALWLVRGKVSPPQEPAMTQLTTQESENRVTAAALSPDGKNLAFAALGNSIYLRRMNDGFTQPISTPLGLNVDRIAWFADGTRLLVSGSASNQLIGVWVIPIGTGTPKMLIPDGKSAVPSPDGKRIAFTNLDGSAIWVAGVRGDAAREVRAGGNGTSFSSLIWSPDSKRIAYQRQDYSPQMNRQVDQAFTQLQKNYAYSYESVDIATGRLVASAKNVVISSACGLPDGRVLFLRWISPALAYVDQLWELRTNPHTGKLRGPPRRLTHATNLALSSISSSNDGKQVVAVMTTNRPNVYIADLPPSGQVPHLLNIRRLTFAQADEYPHAWVPDDRTIIFESNRNGKYDLYRQNIHRGEAKQLVVSPDNNVLPQVSPDGKWILYRSMQGISRWVVMRIPIDGGKPVPTDGELGEFRCPLQAGTPCVLRTVVNSQFVFNELDPVRGAGRELATTEWSPTIPGDWDVSPDGSEVAIPNHSPDSAKIRLVALRNRTPGKAEKTVVLSGLKDLNGVIWAADGRGWYVSMRTGFGGRLFYVDLQGHSTELLESANPIYAVPSPDGRHVAFPQPRAWSNVWLFHGL